MNTHSAPLPERRVHRTPVEAFLGVLLSILLLAAPGRAAGIHQAQGEMAGEVTASSVLLQSRLTSITGPALDEAGDVPGAAGVACFEWSESADFAKPRRTGWMTARAEGDFIVRATLDGLKPATRYYYRRVAGADQSSAKTGPTRQFKTLPAADSSAPVSFCMGSCMNYHPFMSGKANGGGPVTATDEDKRLGYPAFAAMAKLAPDFFIGAGDIVYYDKGQPFATELPELRKKWHEQFRFPRLVEFFARTPAYWSKDDHDFRFDDADLGGEKLPLPATGIELFREQMPIHAAGDRATPTYRTHRVQRHLQLWFTEGRDYRTGNKQPDGPEKTIWGAEQREWLKRTLKESDATWKIIVTPTPMVGPDRNSKTDNHTNLRGFRHEADTFFQWLRDQGLTNVLTFCGDRHWQYHSIHPLGVEEFSVGALNDENSIRGERPGLKGTTDPDGLIRQPYIYREPTGGFLHVRVGTNDQGQARLVIEHRDDHGVVLNSVTKTAAAR